ncbi:VOC family protein [Parafrankia sp. EUN1f]|uniref:VOC family protein n=1 Tax=Parafrankia sp. EUN1f TaxID=102897 RepID=UPI0001C46B7D|nr:VOC family protein [Parafrankia sp. EUN1f]EFC83103.1 Glyoxalase/bleomycin resistance protein/dioxygenase [Parafrankia sp. EUN1f]
MPELPEKAAGSAGVVSHIGLCVSDYERSLRFYTEGLGFEVAEGYDIGSSLAGLAEVEPPVRCRSQMIVKGHTKLELLGWKTPTAEGSALTTRAQIGFTHLSVYVDDLAATEALLVSLGATPIERTRTRVPMPDGAMDVLFLADPDGIRVELVQVTREPGVQ